MTQKILIGQYFLIKLEGTNDSLGPENYGVGRDAPIPVCICSSFKLGRVEQ